MTADRQLAKDILTLAASGGMPDTFWHTDTRVQRAVAVLGKSTYVCKRWAEWAAEAGRQ